MVKRRRILLVAFLVVVLCGTARWVLRPREPLYQGRPLSAWLHDLVNVGVRERLPAEQVRDLLEEKEKKSKVAENVIRQIGTNALPTLFRLLRSKDSKLRQNIYVWSTKQPISFFRLEGANDRRGKANVAFLALGEIAEPAIPTLISMLRERNEYQVPITTDALRAIGPKAFLPLQSALTNSDRLVQVAALDALREIVLGMPEAIAIPAIAGWLTHPSPRVRGVAADNLSKYQSAAKAAIPGLLKTLIDSNEEVRIHSAKALKLIDPEAATRAGVK